MCAGGIPSRYKPVLPSIVKAKSLIQVNKRIAIPSSPLSEYSVDATYWRHSSYPTCVLEADKRTPLTSFLLVARLLATGAGWGPRAGWAFKKSEPQALASSLLSPLTCLRFFFPIDFILQHVTLQNCDAAVSDAGPRQSRCVIGQRSIPGPLPLLSCSVLF